MKNEIIFDLSKNTKRKLTSKIIDRINKNNFNKLDFDKLSKNENVNIKKINLKNLNDDEILKKKVVNHIYTFAEKRMIVVTDSNFSENYLIFIDKIENATIDENSKEYQKYLDYSSLLQYDH